MAVWRGGCRSLCTGGRGGQGGDLACLTGGRGWPLGHLACLTGGRGGQGVTGWHASPIALPFRPIQVLVQKIERSFAVDGVRADEPFDLAAVAQAESSFIEIADLGEL